MIRGWMALLIACVAFSVSAEKRLKDYPPQQVAEDVWVIHGPRAFPNIMNQGFMNNPAFVITAEGVVVVDPGSSRYAGEMVLRMIRTVTDAPVIASFNTHVHGDHWFGNEAIRSAYPDAPIYAHPKMIEDAKAGEAERWKRNLERLSGGFTAGTRIEYPSIPLSHGDEIVIGGKTFRMHHYGVAHSASDLMVEVVEDKVVFLGDNAMAQRFGGMQSGTFLGNIDALDQILKTGAEVWIPGHGPSGGREVVTTYLDYLKTIYETARKAFNEGMESGEVSAIAADSTVTYRDWAGYGLEMRRHAVQAYLEVEEQEF